MDYGESLGKIISWNGETTIPESWWSNKGTSLLNSSDGNLYKPYLSKEDNITIFAPDLCR